MARAYFAGSPTPTPQSVREPGGTSQLTDEERATITSVIDALVTKASLRLITGGAG